MEHEWKTVDNIHEQNNGGISLLYMNKCGHVSQNVVWDSPNFSRFTSGVRC